MFTEVVSPGAVSPGKTSGGRGGSCGGAHGDFSAILSGIYTPGLSSALVSLKLEPEEGPSRRIEGRGFSDLEESGEPEEDSRSEEDAGRPLLERLQLALQELFGDDFSSAGFLAQWEELPLPLKEQFLSILAGEAPEEQLLPGRAAFPQGGEGGELKENTFLPCLPGKGQPEEGVLLKDGVFPKGLVQGSGGGDTGKAADFAGAFGVYPGDSSEQNSGAAGKKYFMNPRQEAAIDVKTPPPGEIIPGPLADEGALKGSSLVSTLYGEGALGEGMRNASSSSEFLQPSGLLQDNFRDTMEQILRRMDYLVRQGGQELRLKLQPEFLGEVLIRMRRMRGVLSAEIITSHPAVKEMLEGQLDTLHRRFQQMDLNVESFDVLLKDGGEDGFAFGREPRGDEPPPAGTLYSTPGLSGAGEEEAPFSGYFDGGRQVDYLV